MSSEPIDAEAMVAENNYLRKDRAKLLARIKDLEGMIGADRAVGDGAKTLILPDRINCYRAENTADGKPRWIAKIPGSDEPYFVLESILKHAVNGGSRSVYFERRRK